MEFPFHSSISDPGNGVNRAYKCLITDALFSYKKSSSTDGSDAKAAAFASLTAAQVITIDTLVSGGHLQRKPVAKYEVSEVRAAYQRSIA